eukprot:bmy_09557T0
MKPRRRSRGSAGALPRRQPRTPGPRDSTNHGARGRPPPPAAATGERAGERRPAPAPTDPSPQATRVAQGLTHHLRLAPRTASQPVTVSRPRGSLPFPGLPPHIRRKCVRPGEEGRRVRGTWREPRGAGAPTPEVPRDRGPRAQSNACSLQKIRKQQKAKRREWRAEITTEHCNSLSACLPPSVLTCSLISLSMPSPEYYKLIEHCRVFTSFSVGNPTSGSTQKEKFRWSWQSPKQHQKQSDFLVHLDACKKEKYELPFQLF